MTSQKLLDEAWKQAQEITNWFHVKASPDNDPRAVEHLAIRLAEFAASCLAEKEKEIAELRRILIEGINELGGCTDDVSTAFLAHLPEEIRLRKKRSLEALKAQQAALESTLKSREQEIERLKAEICSVYRQRDDDYRDLSRRLSAMQEQYEANIKSLLDPIVRAKMLEPPPPIIIESATLLARAESAERELAEIKGKRD